MPCFAEADGGGTGGAAETGRGDVGRTGDKCPSTNTTTHVLPLAAIVY